MKASMDNFRQRLNATTGSQEALAEFLATLKSNCFCCSHILACNGNFLSVNTQCKLASKQTPSALIAGLCPLILTDQELKMCTWGTLPPEKCNTLISAITLRFGRAHLDQVEESTNNKM